MITAKIKQILTDSGCTLVIYEQDKLANLYTDQSDQFDVVGVLMQPNEVTLEVKANAIQEHYNPLTIDVIQQVRLEDAADNNEVRLQALLDICKQIIVRLIAEAEFKTLLPVNVVKVYETKYDANVIGWTLPLNLIWLKNENRDPCIDPYTIPAPAPVIPVPLALELTFDDIANVPVTNASSVSDWNTFFDLPANGIPFTSVIIIGNIVKLYGGSGITIKTELFALPDGFGNYFDNTTLISVIDNAGCIIIVSSYSFWHCTAMTDVYLPVLIIIKEFAFCTCGIINFDAPLLVAAGESSFDGCISVVNLDFPLLMVIGNGCFWACISCTNFNLPSCILLGTSTSDDNVFRDIGSSTLTLTIPIALITCDGGSPDGDIVYLTNPVLSNTVTIITV